MSFSLASSVLPALTLSFGRGVAKDALDQLNAEQPRQEVPVDGMPEKKTSRNEYARHFTNNSAGLFHP
jgi:hypothetical protein